LILSADQDQAAAEVAATDIRALLEPFNLTARAVVQPDARRPQHDSTGPETAAGWRPHERNPESDASTASGFDPERFSSLVARSARACPGLEYRQSPKMDRAGLPWREELVGIPTRGPCSGAIVSLLDTCGGASVWMALGQFQPIVTIDLRLDYLGPR
jgi:hypothetical protein